MISDTAHAGTTQELGLGEADFWAHPFAAAMRVQDAAAGRAGLGLCAPAVIDVGARATLPVFAYDARSTATRAFHDHAVIHVLDVATGDARAARLHPAGTVAGGAAAETRVTRVELRALLDLGWRAADLLATLVVLGRPPARARLRLELPGGLNRQSARRFVAEERARLGPPAATLDAERCPGAAKGLTIAVDPVSRGGRWTLRCTFNLSLYPGQLVPMVRKAAGSEAPPWRSDQAAVVPIDLLFVGAVSPEPVRFVVRAAVPDRGATVSGAFTLDLGKILPEAFRLAAQQVHVLAFSGEHVVGPAPTMRLADDALASPLG